MNYHEEIVRSMIMLSEHPKTIFIGQSVLFGGTGFYDSFIDVPENKKIEAPVAEYLQMGLCNGMAIDGLIPICVFSRWNFLLLATDQIVNHLDKFPIMSNGKCLPKVIIRVAIGAERPIDPQSQHKGNFTNAFKQMLTNINVVELESADDIYTQYYKALYESDGISTILVEKGELSRK